MNKMTGILLAAVAASMGGAMQALAETGTASTMVTYKYPLYCVIDLSGGSSAQSYPVAYMSAPPSEGFNTAEYKTAKLVLKRVDAGSFKMKDSMAVTLLSKPFYMGLYEVTQRQWELVTGSNPCSSISCGEGDAYPVHKVSYDMIRGTSNGKNWPESNLVDSSSFLGKLRDRTKLDFDLPTEAQWEYACRAGTTTVFSYGDDPNGAYMWYSRNSSHRTNEVGTRLPNKWGFYDMHGNVWEWCLDWDGGALYGTDLKGAASGSYRVCRGGDWCSGEYGCTSSAHSSSYSSYSSDCLGFRISRVLP